MHTGLSYTELICRRWGDVRGPCYTEEGVAQCAVGTPWESFKAENYCRGTEGGSLKTIKVFWFGFGSLSTPHVGGKCLHFSRQFLHTVPLDADSKCGRIAGKCTWMDFSWLKLKKRNLELYCYNSKMRYKWVVSPFCITRKPLIQNLWYFI